MPVLTLLYGVYPLVAHMSVLAERPGVAVLVLSLLLLSSAVHTLVTGGHLLAGSALLMAAATAATAGLLGWGGEFLYLPPLLFSAAFMMAFGMSLLSGQTPVVTRMALAMGEHDTATMRWYTRRVTAAWCLFFLGMLMLSLFLALFASPQVWSWFAYFGSYILVGTFFLGEYLLRGRWFPEHRFRRLGHFVSAFVGVDRSRQG